MLSNKTEMWEVSAGYHLLGSWLGREFSFFYSSSPLPPSHPGWEGEVKNWLWGA